MHSFTVGSMRISDSSKVQQLKSSIVKNDVEVSDGAVVKVEIIPIRQNCDGCSNANLMS